MAVFTERPQNIIHFFRYLNSHDSLKNAVPYGTANSLFETAADLRAASMTQTAACPGAVNHGRPVGSIGSGGSYKTSDGAA